MFSGIVQGRGTVTSVFQKKQGTSVSVQFPSSLLRGLEIGMSVALDGVCLTVAGIIENVVSFDLLTETKKRTTLGEIKSGGEVNLERSLVVGHEVGGHILSGHVSGTAEITTKKENIVSIALPEALLPYFFPQGYIAIDGISLTVVSVDHGICTVHLIPETLKRTTLGGKKVGDRVNVEADQTTRAVVDTVLRMRYNKEQ